MTVIYIAAYIAIGVFVARWCYASLRAAEIDRIAKEQVEHRHTYGSDYLPPRLRDPAEAFERDGKEIFAPLAIYALPFWPLAVLTAACYLAVTKSPKPSTYELRRQNQLLRDELGRQDDREE